MPDRHVAEIVGAWREASRGTRVERSYVRDVKQRAEREFVRIRAAKHEVRFQQQRHFRVADLEAVAVGHANFERLKGLIA